MDPKLKKELLCIHDIIRKVQDKLDTCFEDNPYSIRCVYTDDYKKIKHIFSIDKNACHKLDGLCDLKAKSCFSAVVFMKETGEIASYVLFSEQEVSKDMKRFLPEGTYPDFINIDFICTPLKYRRRGLALLLQYVPVLFAMKENMSVSAQTNEGSGPLLQRLGFTKTDDFLGQFNFNADTYLEPTIDNKKFVDQMFNDICRQVRVI
jgi:hypothetical protein